MSGKSIKGGSLFIESVDVPDSVEAGHAVTAEVTVVNDASVISPWDEDQCRGGGFLSNYGYSTTVVFDGPDGTQEKTACVVSDDFHAGTETFTFVFDAPNTSGLETVSAHIETSSATSGEATSTMNVGGGDPAEPSGDGAAAEFWDRIDGDGGDGGGDGSPLDPFGGVEQDAKIAVGIILLFAAMYVSGQLFNVNVGGGS